MDVVRVGVTPWAHMKPHCIPAWKTGCQAGVELDILYTIAEILNLKLLVIIANGTGCGKTPVEEGSNGSWTGLFKMLRDGKIDMIGNFCDTRKLALLKQDFFSTSRPVWQYKEQFVIKTPKPPPLSFAPFAPFSRPVWFACFIVYVAFLGFLTFYYYLQSGSVDGILVQIRKAEAALRDTCLGIVKHVPFEIVWPFWIILLTFMFMFYNTYILSAVLHPYPVMKPFSDTTDLASALLSGKFRLLTHRAPPSVPSACMHKECQRVFEAAIQKYNYEFIPSATGNQLLGALADQDPEHEPKLALVQGEPFIKLYLNEYRKNQGFLWIIDDEGSFEKWSAYVWRKNLSFTEQFNAHLLNIGDYKSNALSRYLQLHGTRPYMGDRVSEVAQQQAIGFRRFRTLFYVHFGGMVIATVVFFMEHLHARCRQDQYPLLALNQKAT